MVTRKQHGGGRSKLTAAEIVDIFHRAHAVGGEPYRVIAKRYGITGEAVGDIARAQVHAHLFRREAIPESYDFWVSAANGVGPRYRMTAGKRTRRGMVWP